MVKLATVLVLCLSSIASAQKAPAKPKPKTLWELTFVKDTYTLRARGTTGDSGAFDVIKKELAKLQSGEWLVEDNLTGVAPAAELADLVAIAKQRGAIVRQTNGVVTGQIPNTKYYSRGSITKVTLVIKNHSPYAVKVTMLRLGGCAGRGDVILKGGLELAPGAKKKQVVEVTNIVNQADIPANCMRGDGWFMTTSGADFDVIP